MTNTNNLPETLKQRGLFCLWKYESRDGRQTKMPYDPNSPQDRAKSNDRSTFAPMATAQARAAGFDGIGIGIFDDIAGIDIDHCIDDAGQLSPMAQDIVQTMDAYTEISPSGKGLRILFLAPGFQYDKDRYYIKESKQGLEVYIAGMTNRYLTVTGNTLRSSDLVDRTKQLQSVLDRYMKRNTAEQQPQGQQTLDSWQYVRMQQRTAADLSDRELIDRAMNAGNGSAFTSLWNGDISGYPSHSEADQALCNLLAFWTNKDAARMDSLFRQSGLMRDKWNRRQSGTTYGAITISKAIAGCAEGYTPPQEATASPQANGTPAPGQTTPADEKVPQNGAEQPKTGLLTLERAIKILDDVDDHYLELPHFPQLSDVARIRTHDSIVIAADTGAGKSSLALNILHELQDRYPAMYINLEMDEATILQRLVAIHTGMELDKIEGYKQDKNTRDEVNAAINDILSRKEIRLLTDSYDLQEIEAQIKAATQGRTEPTIVFIDTGLLVTTSNKSASRYERFTHISEELRRISRLNNIVMFVLLQQNRESKKKENADPRNSSLKESGSWENDATKIIFLSGNTTNKKLSITKNRSGKLGEIKLNYSAHTQTYSEPKNSYIPFSAFHSTVDDEDDSDNPKL